MSRPVLSHEKPNGTAKAVALMRAGSGGCVIDPPSEIWLRAMQKINPGGGYYEGGAECRVLFIPECDGYDNLPGCKIMIAPGNHEGGFVGNMKKRTLVGIPDSESLLDFSIGRGMFSISTNLTDLKMLHGALGEVIASIDANVAAREK